MNRGKYICKELKAVRRRIAEENDIALEIPECTYKGPCKGTCPRCESEVRFLENELVKRIKLGKVATVAGLALGLAVSNGAKAQDTLLRQQQAAASSPNIGEEQCCGTLKGRVFDLKTNEPLPFCKVVLRKGEDTIASGATDFDGMYTLKKIPFGDYTLSIQTMLYAPFEQCITITKQGFTVMDVSLSTMDMMGMPMIETGVQAITTIETPTAPPTPIRAYGKSVEEVARQVGLEKMRAVMGEVQVRLPGIEASLAGDPPPIPKHVWSLDEMKLVGGLGYNEVDGPPTIRVVREGPLLIVDESDEPQF